MSSSMLTISNSGSPLSLMDFSISTISDIESLSALLTMLSILQWNS